MAKSRTENSGALTLRDIRPAQVFFNEFRKSRLLDYSEAAREYRVWPEGGFPNFYKDSEVVQCMFNIYANLDETYADLRIPQGFPSPSALVRSWQSFLTFLNSYDALFQEVRQYLRNGPDADSQDPEVLHGIDRRRHETIDALEETLRLARRGPKPPPKQKLKTGQAPALKKDRDEGASFPVVIITALHSPEYRELKKRFTHLKPFNAEDLSRAIYKEGVVTMRGKPTRALLVSANQMGMPAAATLTTKLIYRYNAKVVAMCGISAGIKGAIGDILVPDTIWDYGSGKRYAEKDDKGKILKEDLFAPYRNPEAMPNEVTRRMIELADDDGYLRKIYDEYPDEMKWKQRFPKQLEAKVGPYASGAAVIADDHILEEIKAQDGKLIGFDMEAYGVLYACNNCSASHKPLCVIAKSISDYGDSNKGGKLKDKYQAYAAFTSAAYLMAFLQNEVELIEQKLHPPKAIVARVVADL